MGIDPRFTNATLIVAILNAVGIGIESGHNTANHLYDANLFFQKTGSQFFCMLFTFEWVVRLLAFNNFTYAFRDGWLKFDTFLFATMLVETWILMPVLNIAAVGGQINKSILDNSIKLAEQEKK